jgi:hypothetical protein
MILVNIGLDRPDGLPRNTVPRVMAEIAKAGWRVDRWRMAQSATEPTIAAVIDTGDAWSGPGAVWMLAHALGQDAIAWCDETGTGHLTGPRADRWGAFDPAFWIAP